MLGDTNILNVSYDSFWHYRLVIYSWFHIKGTWVYTCSIETIYLSMRAQVAVGTFFMKSPVSKHTFMRSGSSKQMVLFSFLTTLNTQCGHQIVVLSTKFVVMRNRFYVLALWRLWYIKNTFIRSGSSKKTVLFNVDHFKHSLWSSNSGHAYPILRFCTICLWCIKTHIYILVLFGTIGL